MIALTKNFALEEIWAHDSRPTQDQARTCYVLARSILQPLRDYMSEPIKITSGYRAETIAGGAAKSEHFYGAHANSDLENYEGAVDINIGKAPNAGRNLLAFNWLANNCRYSLGQLIWYTETTHLHISLAGPRHIGELLVCTSKKAHTYKAIGKASEISQYDKRLTTWV